MSPSPTSAPPQHTPPMSAWRAPAIAFLLLLAAILLPPFNAPRTTYDYLVVFDITQSMNVEDYELDGAPGVHGRGARGGRAHGRRAHRSGAAEDALTRACSWEVHPGVRYGRALVFPGIGGAGVFVGVIVIFRSEP